MIVVVVPLKAMGPASNVSAFVQAAFPAWSRVQASSASHCIEQTAIFLHVGAHSSSTTHASPWPQPVPVPGPGPARLRRALRCLDELAVRVELLLAGACLGGVGNERRADDGVGGPGSRDVRLPERDRPERMRGLVYRVVRILGLLLARAVAGWRVGVVRRRSDGRFARARCEDAKESEQGDGKDDRLHGPCYAPDPLNLPETHGDGARPLRSDVTAP